MAVTEMRGAGFSVGRVAERTISVFARNLPAFVPLAVLAALPNFLLNFLVLAWVSDPVENLYSLTGTLIFVGSVLASALGYSILQAGIIHGTVADFNGRRARFSECFSVGLAEFFPVLAVSILSTLGIFGGALFFLIPGIILALMWIVAIPVRVVEHRDALECFSRSSELSRGYRWQVFGLLLVYVVLAIAFGISIALVGVLVEPLLTNAISNVITVPIAACGVASIYYELRVAKEGIGPEALAAVFD